MFVCLFVCLFFSFLCHLHFRIFANRKNVSTTCRHGMALKGLDLGRVKKALGTTKDKMANSSVYEDLFYFEFFVCQISGERRSLSL